MIERDLMTNLKKWLGEKEVLIIRGPRQSGKTTLLGRIKEVIEKEDGFAEYITFEDDFEKDKFESDPEGYIKFYWDKEKKTVLLIDEIQYVKNAGKILKLIYDKLGVKMIVTGSSTMDINEIGSNLVGRGIFFELHPFSFREFLRAKDSKLYSYYEANKFSFESKRMNLLFNDRLNVLMKEYIAFGGYPRVVLEESSEKKNTLLKNLYLTYVEKDVVKLYGDEYRRKIFELVKIFAANNGSIVNYNEVCTMTGFYHNEVKDVLSILVDTYIIRLVRPYYKNLVTELKKNPKTYFFDSGLRNFLIGRYEFSDKEWGILFENYAANLFDDEVRYWRTTAKAEVDFIVHDLPIEVKYSGKITRSFRSFLKTYKPKRGFVLNAGEYKVEKVEDCEIYFIPLSLLERNFI